MAILTVSVGPLQVFSVLGRNVYFWLGCLWFGCRAGRAALFSSYLGHLCVCLDNLHWGCFVIFNLSWKAACPTQPLEVNTRGGAPSRCQRWLMTSAGGPGEGCGFWLLCLWSLLSPAPPSGLAPIQERTLSQTRCRGDGTEMFFASDFYCLSILLKSSKDYVLRTLWFSNTWWRLQRWPGRISLGNSFPLYNGPQAVSALQKLFNRLPSYSSCQHHWAATYPVTVNCYWLKPSEMQFPYHGLMCQSQEEPALYLEAVGWLPFDLAWFRA